MSWKATIFFCVAFPFICAANDTDDTAHQKEPFHLTVCGLNLFWLRIDSDVFQWV
jgi:hypothetical protein